MSDFNINFDPICADNVESGLRHEKHLLGFEQAERILFVFRDKLSTMRFNAEWWGNKCKEVANHYARMQEDYSKNPENYSQEHKREAFSKSPREYYTLADGAEQAEKQVLRALDTIDEILSRLHDAEEDAKEQSIKIVNTVMRATNLATMYANTRF